MKPWRYPSILTCNGPLVFDNLRRTNKSNNAQSTYALGVSYELNEIR